MDDGGGAGTAGAVDNSAQLLAEIDARLKEVDGLLGKKEKVKALLVALRNPPAGCKNEAVKDANAAVVDHVLSKFQDADVPPAIEALSLEACDVLMKYVYKFMGRAQNCALMLKLHAQLEVKAGAGSIMRVLTDRKTI
jgi:actin related protein 2/3 complex subunit 5